MYVHTYIHLWIILSLGLGRSLKVLKSRLLPAIYVIHKLLKGPGKESEKRRICCILVLWGPVLVQLPSLESVTALVTGSTLPHNSLPPIWAQTASLAGSWHLEDQVKIIKKTKEGTSKSLSLIKETLEQMPSPYKAKKSYIYIRILAAYLNA